MGLLDGDLCYFGSACHVQGVTFFPWRHGVRDVELCQCQLPEHRDSYRVNGCCDAVKCECVLLLLRSK